MEVVPQVKATKKTPAKKTPAKKTPAKKAPPPKVSLVKTLAPFGPPAPVFKDKDGSLLLYPVIPFETTILFDKRAVT